MFYRTCLAFALATTSSLSALPIVWHGGHVGDPADLTEPLNWTGGVVPNQPNNVAQFDSTATTLTPTLGALSFEILAIENLLFPAATPDCLHFSD